MSNPKWGYRRASPTDPKVLGLPEGVYGEIFEDGRLAPGFRHLSDVDQDGDVDADDLKPRRKRKGA